MSLFFSRSKPDSIVVFRALQLGDLLCTLPAFRALRAAFPSARITLIGLPWAKNFVQRFSHYFDDFLEFPGYPGLPEKKPEIKKFPSFLLEAQSRHFDLALQLHGSGSYVNSIVDLLGARRTAGFFVQGDYVPDSELFLPYPEQEHEILKYLKLMEFLGIPLKGEDLEFPITPLDETEFHQVENISFLESQRYICIHPGARFKTRRWLPERFSEIAEEFSGQGFLPVLTGSAEEISLADDVSRHIRAPHLNLAGKTSLGALACLLKKARLLLCNDTGISHLASALKVPSLVLTLGSDPQRWAPLNFRLHRTLFEPVSCRPCMHQEECPLGFACAHLLETERVLKISNEILEEKTNGSLCAL
jgi:ADP-heptose:LPS heptosyltransferase